MAIKKIIKKYRKKLPDSGYDFFSRRTSESNEYSMLKLNEIREQIKFVYSVYRSRETEKTGRDSFADSMFENNNEQHNDLTKLEISEKVFERVVKTIQTHRGLKGKLDNFADKFEDSVHSERVSKVLRKDSNYLTKGKMYESFTSSNKMKEEKLEIDRFNLINIRICTTHALIYIMAYTMIGAVTNDYVKALKINNDHAGFLMELSSVLSVAGGLIFGYMTNTKFRQGFLLCNLICAVSYIFFSISCYFEFYGMRLFCLIVCRLLLGIGNAKAISRRYVLQFVPQNQIRNFSFEYSALMALGASLGPFTNFLIKFISDNENLNFTWFDNNVYTILGYFGLFLMLVHTLFIYLFFKDPYDVDFKITKGEENFGEELKVFNEPINDEEKDELSSSHSSMGKESFISVKDNGFIITLIIVALSLTMERAMLETVLAPVWYFNSDVLKYVPLSRPDLSLFIAIISLLCFFFVSSLKFLNEKIQERQIIVFMFVLGGCGTFICIPLFYCNIWVYLIGFTFTFFAGNGAEGVLSSLLSKNLPNKYNEGTFNAGFYVLLMTSIGKAIGGSSTSINHFVQDPTLTIKIIYSVTTFFVFITIVLLCIFYNHLVVKLKK